MRKNNRISCQFIYSLAKSENNIFAGTFYSGIFLSSDNGGSWTTVNNDLPLSGIEFNSCSENNIFTGTFNPVSVMGTFPFDQ
ncbi:MAG: hypothetical protein IPL53_15100 [Ignavibacteria bacterium]|nr:hypothetical protein [Ignavibacteria bacterium]